MTEPTWIDLEVAVESLGEAGYRASLRSPGGEATVTFPPPFAPGDLLKIRELVIAGMGRESGDVQKVLEAAGRELFRAVFHDDAAVVLRLNLEEARREGRRLRIRLHLRRAREANVWPWEYLGDEVGPLEIAEDAPIVRYLDLARPIRPLAIELPLRVLVVIADVGPEPLDVEAEWRQVQAAFEPLVTQRRAVLDRLSKPLLSALERRLRKEEWHVVHFVGHGRFHGETGAGEILLRGERGGVRYVEGRKLASALRGRQMPRLVVLNACESARTREDDSFAGVAPSLVWHGVPAVVAMQYPISDAAAIDWVGRFYREIVEEQPVDAALAIAKREMFFGEHAVEWGTLVLYLRTPDGRLFVTRRSQEETTTSHPIVDWLQRMARSRALRLVAGSLLLILASWFALYRMGYLPPNRLSIVEVAGARPIPPVQNPPECPTPRGASMQFVLVQPGRFMMGSADEAQPTEVPRPFCLGTYEVTQGQWKEVLGSLPEGFPSPLKGDQLPVLKVSYPLAMKFVRALNQKEGGAVFRLPTEAEWEYAARAGKSFGEEPPPGPGNANCGSSGPARVGSFGKNPWGFYDMNGNVAEWVSDTDEGKETQVRKGGSFSSVFKSCRSSNSSKVQGSRHNQDTGLRIVREIASP